MAHQQRPAALATRNPCDVPICGGNMDAVRDPSKEDATSESTAAARDAHDAACAYSHDILQAMSPGQSSTVPTMSGFSGLSEKLHDTACGSNAAAAIKQENTPGQTSEKSCSSTDHHSNSQQEGTGTSQPGANRTTKVSPFMAVCEAAGLGLQQRLFASGQNMQVSQQRLVEMQQELMAHPEVALISAEACTSVFWSEHAKLQEEYYEDLVALEAIMAKSIAAKDAKPEAATHYQQIKTMLMYLRKKREKVHVDITRAQLLGLYRVKKVVQNYVQLYKQISKKIKSTSVKPPQPVVTIPSALLPSLASRAMSSPSTVLLKRPAPGPVSGSSGADDSLLDSLFTAFPAQKKSRLAAVAADTAESTAARGRHGRKPSLDLETVDGGCGSARTFSAPSPLCSVPSAQSGCPKPPLSQGPIPTICSTPSNPAASLLMEASSSNLSVFSASIIRSNPRWPSTLSADLSGSAGDKTFSAKSDSLASPPRVIPMGLPAPTTATASTQGSISQKFPPAAPTPPSRPPSSPAQTQSSVSEMFISPTLTPAAQALAAAHPAPGDHAFSVARVSTQSVPVPTRSVAAHPPSTACASSAPLSSPASDFLADLDEFCPQDPLPTAMSDVQDMMGAPVLNEDMFAGAEYCADPSQAGADNMQRTCHDSRQPLYYDGTMGAPDMHADAHMQDPEFLECAPHLPDMDAWHFPVEPAATVDAPPKQLPAQDHRPVQSTAPDDLDVPFLNMLDDFMADDDQPWSPESFTLHQEPSYGPSYDCWTPDVPPQEQYTPQCDSHSPVLATSFADTQQPPKRPLLQMLTPSKDGWHLSDTVTHAERQPSDMAHVRYHTTSYYASRGVDRQLHTHPPASPHEPLVADVAYFTASRGRLQPSYKTRMLPRSRPAPHMRSPVSESWHWHAQAQGHAPAQHPLSRFASRGV